MSGLRDWLLGKCSDPVEQYLLEVYKGLRYHATWEPNSPLEVGDIGTVKNNQFIYESDLESKGIDFKIRKDRTKGDMFYASEGGVNFFAKAAGNANIIKGLLGGVEADFAIQFKRKNATYLSLGETLTHSIRDQHAVAKEIEQRYHDGKWESNWAVVTELIEAKNGIILISGEKESSVGLNLAGEGKIPYTDINLANAKVGLQLVGGHSLFRKFCTCEGITPLLKIFQMEEQIQTTKQPLIYSGYKGAHIDYARKNGSTFTIPGETRVDRRMHSNEAKFKPIETKAKFVEKELDVSQFTSYTV